MQRDHLFGYPPATMAAEPAPTTPRYPLGRPTRDPEPAPVWPFPAAPKKVFVPDSRTPDSDKPKVAAQKPIDAREASFKDFHEKVANDTDSYARLIEMRGGCSCHLHPPCGPCSSPLTEDEAKALGWEPPEAEKPAHAEPQATPQPDAEGWIEHDGKGMPIHGTTMIETRLRRGTIHKDHAAFWHDEDPKYSNWVHEPCPLDIVAYRVVSA